MTGVSKITTNQITLAPSESNQGGDQEKGVKKHIPLPVKVGVAFFLVSLAGLNGQRHMASQAEHALQKLPMIDYLTRLPVTYDDDNSSENLGDQSPNPSKNYPFKKLITSKVIEEKLKRIEAKISDLETKDSTDNGSLEDVDELLRKKSLFEAMLTKPGETQIRAFSKHFRSYPEDNTIFDGTPRENMRLNHEIHTDLPASMIVDKSLLDNSNELTYSGPSSTLSSTLKEIHDLETNHSLKVDENGKVKQIHFLNPDGEPNIFATALFTPLIGLGFGEILGMSFNPLDKPTRLIEKVLTKAAYNFRLGFYVPQDQLEKMLDVMKSSHPPEEDAPDPGDSRDDRQQ